jgi:hypothetical protein
MRPGPPTGAARARARSGVAPALLLDVQTPSGDIYYWSDRRLKNMPAAITADGNPAMVDYTAWLLGSGSFSFNRSLNTDTGSLTLQNLSGDVLQSDFERIVRRGTLEGSLYVFRYYQVDMQWAWLEQHGTLTVGDTSRSTVQLGLVQLLSGSDDTPEQTVSETCQLVWGEKRCGATGDTECLYTYASCQVPEHFTGIQTAFETNNPESYANLPTQTFNRKKNW